MYHIRCRKPRLVMDARRGHDQQITGKRARAILSFTGRTPAPAADQETTGGQNMGFLTEQDIAENKAQGKRMNRHDAINWKIPISNNIE